MASRFCWRSRWTTRSGNGLLRDDRVFRSIFTPWNQIGVDILYHRASMMPSKEYEALTSGLATKSQPSTASRAFTQPTKEVVTSGGDVEEQLGNAWQSLISVAADTAQESQEPLVDIIRAVQQERISTEACAQKPKIWGEDVRIWEDMPLLGPSLREAWNRAPGTGSKDDFSAQQWTNLNAFLARLTSLSSSIPAFDFSLYAVWSLRTAFEGSDASQAEVEAARAWFTYAEDTIEGLSKEGKAFDGKIARAGDKYRGQEWKGFNPERLEIWRAALS